MTKQRLDALRITCRLDKERADFVRELAVEMEQPKADVMRVAIDALMKGESRKTHKELQELPPETRQELARLTQEVNRIGTNVNQAVRAINTRVVDEMFILEAVGDGAKPQEIEQMRADLEDLRAVLKGEMRKIFLELVKLRGELEDACQSLKS